MTANIAAPASAGLATDAGAVSRKVMGWQAIDWQQAHRNVRRLQVRIVKATHRGAAASFGAFERLEPGEGKLSRPVLRGEGDGNIALLPGTRETW